MLLTALLVSLCSDVSGAGSQVRLVTAPDAPTRQLVSTEQLEADLAAVVRLRKGVGMPVALVIIGSVSTAVGGLMIGLSTIGFAALAIENPLVVIGLVFVALGLPFVTVGVWMLSERLEVRKRAGQVAEELRRELYERRRWGSQSESAPLRTPMSTLATF